MSAANTSFQREDLVFLYQNLNSQIERQECPHTRPWARAKTSCEGRVLSPLPWVCSVSAKVVQKRTKTLKVLNGVSDTSNVLKNGRGQGEYQNPPFLTDRFWP